MCSTGMLCLFLYEIYIIIVLLFCCHWQIIITYCSLKQYNTVLYFIAFTIKTIQMQFNIFNLCNIVYVNCDNARCKQCAHFFKNLEQITLNDEIYENTTGWYLRFWFFNWNTKINSLQNSTLITVIHYLIIIYFFDNLIIGLIN